MKRLHCLAFRAPPHGGARLGGWTAPAGGSARVGPGKFLLRKTRSTAESRASSCEAKPGGRPSRPSFRVPLRGRLAVLHWLPFARLFASPRAKRILEEHRLNPRAPCFVAASEDPGRAAGASGGQGCGIHLWTTYQRLPRSTAAPPGRSASLVYCTSLVSGLFACLPQRAPR